MRQVCTGLNGWEAFVDILNRYVIAIIAAFSASVVIGVCLGVAAAYLLIGLYIAVFYGYLLLVPATVALGAVVYCIIQYDDLSPHGFIVSNAKLLLSAVATLTGGCYLWVLAGSGFGSLVFGLGAFCTASMLLLEKTSPGGIPRSQDHGLNAQY